MQRLKIVHVVESFAGGTLSFINTLVSELPEFDHCVIHGERSEELSATDARKKFPLGTEFISWSATRNPSVFRDFSSLLELRGYFKSLNLAAIHLHSSKAGFLGRWAAFFAGMGRKVVYTPNALSFLRTDIPDWQKEIFCCLEKCASAAGGTTFGCGESEYQAMKSNGISGNWINNSSLNISKLLKKEPLPKPLNETPFTVVTLGRITEQKNPFRFNKIALHFENSSEIKFVWIGDGNLKQQLTSSNIEITGWLKVDEVLERLYKSDVYLSTSDWEGMPLSVIEAMACKMPLVLFDCVGNRDAVNNNENGFLFNEEQSAIKQLEFLLKNRNLISQFGERSYQIASEKFSPEKMVAAYREQYLEIAAGNASALKFD